MHLISEYSIQFQICLCLILCVSLISDATATPSDLAVDPSNRNLINRYTDEPFPWLGDTAWSAIKELSKSEMDTYLDYRQRQGFTVIQVILIGHDPGPDKYGYHQLNATSAVLVPNTTTPKTRTKTKNTPSRADMFFPKLIFAFALSEESSWPTVK